jgi:Mg-chelatase subunit ChlD
MKQLYLLTCFLLISICSLAEGMQINGVIRDMDTQAPVKDAKVTITFFQNYELNALTDSLGQYSIVTNVVLPAGDYGIRIVCKDYYELSGFVNVTDSCVRDFSIKLKDKPKPVLDGYAANNLVFLIDISASMNTPDRMPVLKKSMINLVGELRPSDRIAILTFSNTVKEILPSTAVSDKAAISKIIEDLSFGSTSEGGAALDIAYKTALSNFVSKGNNRIILASDGLFTSGDKDYKRMQKTIEEGWSKKVSLSIFCFGKNTEYVYAKLGQLAKAGNGNFASILSEEESKTAMIEEAKAVKQP